MAVQWVGPTQVFATFDLNHAPTGQYDVVARQADGRRAELPDGLVVQESQGADLVYESRVAEHLGLYRFYPYTIEYANLGNQDAMPPLFVITSNGVFMGLDAEYVVNDRPIQVLGASVDGPIDTLRPGEKQDANLAFFTRGAPPSYKESMTLSFDVRQIKAYDATPITASEWTEIERFLRADGVGWIPAKITSIGEVMTAIISDESLEGKMAPGRFPGALTDLEWQTFWDQIRPRIGNTWGQYVRFLNDLSRHLAAVPSPRPMALL